MSSATASKGRYDVAVGVSPRAAIRSIREAPGGGDTRHPSCRPLRASCISPTSPGRLRRQRHRAGPPDLNACDSQGELPAFCGASTNTSAGFDARIPATLPPRNRASLRQTGIPPPARAPGPDCQSDGQSLCRPINNRTPLRHRNLIPHHGLAFPAVTSSPP